MQLPAIAARIFHRGEQHGMRKEFAVPNHQLNPRTVHMHDASGADIEMADLAIAHLIVRQTDVWATGMNERIGILAGQTVVSGLTGESDRVGRGFGAITPAVKNDQNEWFRPRHKYLAVLHDEIKRPSSRQQDNLIR